MANIFDIALTVGSIVLLFLSYPYLYTFLVYDRRAKKVGCGHLRTYYSFPLGYTLAWEVLSTWNKDHLLDFANWKFACFYKRRTIRQFVNFEFWIGTIEPENVKAVLATEFKNFSLGSRYEAAYILLGNGIFTLSGEGWKHSRSLLRPQFSREQVSHLDSMHSHINLLINDHLKDGDVVDAQQLYHMLTIDTATEFLFGESTNTLDPQLSNQGFPGPQGVVTGSQFADAFTYALGLMFLRVMLGPLYWLIWTPKFARSAKVCHNFIDYFVLKALANPMEKDEAADRYIFIRELTKETGDPKAIRDQALNILLAGRDTTAALLSYTTFYLGAYPECYKELRENIISEFGREDKVVTFEQLKQCKMLQNVLREVLRLHPVVPVNFRTAVRDTKLPRGGGPNKDEPIYIPKGTKLFYSTYTMQRDKSIWGPDADKFRPERWNEHRTAVASGWDYIPFNGGPRICLGQQFALTEAGFTLMRICQEFRQIEVLHPNPHIDQTNMMQTMRLTSSVSGGVKARFIC